MILVRSTIRWHAIVRSCLTMVAILAMSVGCRREERVITDYGISRGTVGRTSLGGTAGLDHLFQSKGVKTVATRRLSPRLDAYDAIIWFPGSGVPDDSLLDHWETWLSQPGRTLVYVNAGYPPELEYWQRAAQLSQESTQTRALRQRDAELAVKRIATWVDEDRLETCRWFEVHHKRPFPTRCETLRGEWTRHVDTSQCDLQWCDQVTFPNSKYAHKTLLAYHRIPLVTQLTHEDWEDSRVLVVTHGMFLVNLGLINPQHQQLATRLVQACLASDGTTTKVAFLETNTADIRPSTDETGRRAGDLYFVWPLSVPLWHFFVFGAVLCAAFFPTLGRPKPAPRVAVVDFGRHVEALGQLLAATHNSQYARSRLDAYHALTQPESLSPVGSTRRRQR